MNKLPNSVTVDLDVTVAAADHIIGGFQEALAAANGAATFYVPRELAATVPANLRELAAAGHEVGVLTLRKPSCSRPFCSDFRGELSAARDAIESATGVRVRGHRNAGFHLDAASEWVYDVLIDEGFEHDSSRMPPRYQRVDEAPVPRSVHAVRRWGGMLLEVPVSTADVFSGRMALGTAGAVRGLPVPVWRAVVEHRQLRGEPTVLQLKSSDLQTSLPFARSTGGAPNARALRKVSRVVGELGFTSIGKAYSDYLRSAPIIES